MGSYSELRIGSLIFESWKNDIEPSIMMLFVPSDKFVVPISLEKWEADGGDPEAWSTDRCEVRYSCTVRVMRERLELLGFTVDVATKAFSVGVPGRIEWESEFLTFGIAAPDDTTEQDRVQYQTVRETARKMVETLRVLTPDEWVAALRLVHTDNLQPTSRYSEVSDRLPAVQYVLLRSPFRFGFPGADIRCMLRLALEAFSDDDVVTYDLTDLILGGYFEVEAEMVEYAEYLISRENDVFRKRIVLTEGATDSWIIERSLRLLCPHLAPFFSFMDFDSLRIEGGAGVLGNVVKAFAAAGIANRVIALFDNGTAAYNVLENLKTFSFPPNIRLLTLPDLQIAQKYPTLGPAGVSFMNVNGLACSIELYLGRDVLTEADGNLAAVQWRGFDPKLRRYQGEILGKSGIQERFRKRLAICESDPSRISEYDWAGIRAVIGALLSAFREADAEEHLDYERWSRQSSGD